MAIPSAFLDELVARSDIVDVVGDYVNLTPKGGSYWGLCPFHGEKTASFHVLPDRQLYHCFGCGKCDGTQGYPIPLPGGGEGFLCGFGLIPLPTFRAGHVPEVKEALRIQDEFFGKM